MMALENSYIPKMDMLESPPHNIEAEQAVIGHLMANNRAISSLDGLSAEAFYEPLHQRIFGVMVDKIRMGEWVTPVTLKNFFEQDGTLEEVGGQKYLARLLACGALVMNFRDNARVVLDCYRRREIIATCMATMVQARSFEIDSPAEEIAARSISALRDIASDVVGRKFKSEQTVTIELLDDLKDRKDAISTGIKAIDDCMEGGMYPGHCYGFAARKKVGKTIMASTVSFNLARAGIRHLFICAEMGAKRIHERNLARHLKVFPSAFRGNRKNDPNFLVKISDFAVKCSEAMWMVDTPTLTFDELKTIISVGIAKYRIQGFFLDYLQLVGGKQRSESEAQHLGNVAQWIANIAREHNIFAFVTAQINQEGNIRGGESIRQAFDQVYQIHRPDVQDPGVWVEMMDTRYTAWMDIGSDKNPGLWLNPKGPHFQETPIYPIRENNLPEHLEFEGRA